MRELVNKDAARKLHLLCFASVASKRPGNRINQSINQLIIRLLYKYPCRSRKDPANYFEEMLGDPNWGLLFELHAYNQ